MCGRPTITTNLDSKLLMSFNASLRKPLRSLGGLARVPSMSSIQRRAAAYVFLRRTGNETQRRKGRYMKMDFLDVAYCNLLPPHRRILKFRFYGRNFVVVTTSDGAVVDTSGALIVAFRDASRSG